MPGITLGAGEGGNPNGDRPFIRGYNSESSMYVDGVRNATSQNREMFAVEQVEVTKGSASAMGGAGTVGGSINLISKVAKKGDFLEGSVENGTDNYQRITLDGNKDFGNGIAARVAIMGHHNEKAGQSDGAEYKRAGIAPSITFGLDTDTRTTLSYYYLKSDDTPDSGVPYNYDIAKKTTVGKPVNVKQGIYYGLLDRDFQKQENQIGTIKVEHDINDNFTLTNTAVFNKSKNDYLWTQPDDSKGNVVNDKVWRRINSRITDTEIFTDQLALTGKLNTGIIQHKLNMGAEYSDQKSDKGNYNTSYPGYPGTTTGGFNSDCAINDAWCTSLTNPNSKDQWLGTAIVNKAGITFKPVKNGSIYTSFATSANPVGVDGGDGSESIGQAYMDLKPEESRTFEIGTKWNILNDRLNLTAAIFRTEKQNTRIQLDASTYTNGGESKVDGVELSATGKITDKWDITAGYSYLDSELTDPGPSCTRAGVCTYPNPAKGKQLPNVPENSATLWTTYKVLPQLTLGAGAFYSDKVYGDAANTKYVPGYVRYDAMARYNVNKNVDLQLNLNNLSDKRYFTKAYASHYATEAEGRNAVLSLNFKY